VIQDAASSWTENIVADGVTEVTNERVDPLTKARQQVPRRVAGSDIWGEWPVKNGLAPACPLTNPPSGAAHLETKRSRVRASRNPPSRERCPRGRPPTAPLRWTATENHTVLPPTSELTDTVVTEVVQMWNRPFKVAWANFPGLLRA